MDMKRDDCINVKRKKYRLTLLDKVNICLESLGDHVMHVFIEADNRVNPDRFKRAIRLSLDAEPILACRYVYNSWKPYWEEWDPKALDAYVLCTLEPEIDLEQQKLDFLLQKMDSTSEPFVQAKIIRGETDTIAININCISMDGSGLFIYLVRLFDIYNTLALDPDFHPKPSDMALRSARQFSAQFSTLDKIKIFFTGLKNQIINQRTAHNWSFPSSKQGSMQKTFLIKNFDVSTFAAINTYRNRLKATVNDVMLAAYYQSLYKIIQPEKSGPYCVLNTYDLRNHLPTNSVPRAANYSSFINTNIDMQEDTPFNEIVQQVQSSIGEQKENYPGLGEAPALWFLFRFLPFSLAQYVFKLILRARGGTVPVFTNVGMIKTKWFTIDGKAVRNITPIPPLEYPPKLTVSLSTTDDKIALCVGYSTAHFRESDVERLFTLMEAAIPRLPEKIASPERERRGDVAMVVE